jgi:hypothetical protein
MDQRVDLSLPSDPGPAEHMTAEAMLNPALFMSPRIDQLSKALSAAQGEMQNPKKNETATVTSRRTGTTFQYSYATLSAILDTVRVPLKNNGLFLSQIVTGNDLTVMLCHESGQWMRAGIRLQPADSGPQAFASELTAYRRHLIQGLLSISAEDDDDSNIAEGNNVTPGPRDQRRWDPEAPAQPADADPLLAMALRTHNVREGGNLLRLWMVQGRERVEKMRRQEDQQEQFCAVIDAVAKALQRSLGTVLASAWKAIMVATTREQERAVVEKMDGEWADTLAAFRAAEPAVHQDLIRHVTARREIIAANVKAAQAEADRIAKEDAAKGPPFEYRVADFVGDFSDEIYTSAETWARAYEAVYRATPPEHLPLLAEHNAEALMDAVKHFGAEVLLTDLHREEAPRDDAGAARPMVTATRIADGAVTTPTFTTKTPPAPPLSEEEALVTLPKGRGEGYDLAQYLKAIGVSLDGTVRTIADMDVWERVNSPIYLSDKLQGADSTRMRVFRAVAARKRGLGIQIDAE